MKKLNPFVVFAFLGIVFLSSPVFAVEKMGMETGAAAITEAVQPANPFIFMMTDDGKLITKPGKVFTEGGHYENTQMPYLISYSEPINYPRWAVRQGWEGRFDIALEILRDGSVGRTKVMRSTGYSVLDQSAEKGVKTWKFHPALKNGEPIVTCIQIPVLFQLEKD